MWRLDKKWGGGCIWDGKLMEKRQFVYVAFSGSHSLTLVIGCLLSSWYREGTLFYLFFASKRKEVRIGVSFCSCTRYFSIILIYNAQNTKVAYFGVVNFIPLHLVTWSILNPVFPSLKSECKPVNNSLATKEINPFFT